MVIVADLGVGMGGEGGPGWGFGWCFGGGLVGRLWLWGDFWCFFDGGFRRRVQLDSACEW